MFNILLLAFVLAAYLSKSMSFMIFTGLVLLVVIIETYITDNQNQDEE
jgi:hypothetical protein